MVEDVTLTFFWGARIRKAFRLLFTGKLTLATSIIQYAAASIATVQMDYDGEDN